MKTKLEMAHDYSRDIVSNWEYDDSFDPVAEAWQYADAMQAEADKREKEEQDKLKQNERNHHDELVFIGLEEWQPDWSQAPEWANWWATDKDLVSFWHEDRPKFDEIEFYQCGMFCDAPSFNYQGNWKESLRTRPQ